MAEVRKVTFEGATGAQLAARLHMPQGQPKATALFAHCFTCGKDSLAATRIARALAGEGFAVLRFDFTGLGGSDGDFANTDFSSNVADLVAAARWLQSELAGPALLIGHSLGGAAVIAAAGEIESAAAVATIGAPYDVAHVLRHIGDAAGEIEAEGEARVELGGAPSPYGGNSSRTCAPRTSAAASRNCARRCW